MRGWSAYAYLLRFLATNFSDFFWFQLVLTNLYHTWFLSYHLELLEVSPWLVILAFLLLYHQLLFMWFFLLLKISGYNNAGFVLIVLSIFLFFKCNFAFLIYKMLFISFFQLLLDFFYSALLLVFSIEPTSLRFLGFFSCFHY